MTLRAWMRTAFFTGMLLVLLTQSALPPADSKEQIRRFTRSLEFDYVNWTLDAFRSKGLQSAIGLTGYMSDDVNRQLVLDYLELVQVIKNSQAEIDAIYADPNVLDPESVSFEKRLQMEAMQAERVRLGPLAESVIQQQVASVLDELGLDLGGQTVPPILYAVTPLPMALIVSPRDVIRQEANISLQPEMPIEQIVGLEESVSGALDVSALVTPVGGIGAYPTMVISTTDLNFLVEVVAHEWTHNYLTLRPLGINYDTTPELRTMNETTASIAGKEIGREVISRYYPEFLPQSPSPAPPAQEGEMPKQALTPPPFDFRAEMRVTRLQVDEYLSVGEIDKAEAYMESQRAKFWENGFQIRRLNQAYFAFHGAYADLPGGAAGEDPVGEAVRTLRDRSDSLAQFIKRMSWLSSYNGLIRLMEMGR